MTTSKTMQDIKKLLRLCGVTPEAGFVILTLLESSGTENETWEWLTMQPKAPTENMILTKAMELDGQIHSDSSMTASP